MVKVLKEYSLLADGAIFKRLRVVPESLVQTREGRIQLHNWKGLLHLSLVYKHVRLSPHKIYVSVHNSYRGYYHWLLEGLPKLLVAKHTVSNFTLLLPETYTEDFYTDSLQLIGIESVERLQPSTVYRVPQLVLPYVTEPMGTYSASVMNELRAVLLNITRTTVVANSSTRLYVSRRKAERRKVMNEPDIESVLHEFGFQAMCFEDYTFAQQVQLCANAEALVSIHGAGLSNMLFLPVGAIVIEFRKFDDGKNYFFSELATILRHKYHLLYCLAANEQQSVQDADLMVSVEELRKVLMQQYMKPS